MAISPVNFTRVSHNLRTLNMLQSLQQNTRELFTQQTRLATGRNFISASENPVGAAQALRMNETIARQDQILDNLQHADLMLSSADDALAEVNGLIREAEAIAISSSGTQSSAEERIANATLIAPLRERLAAVGNRQVQGRFIFAGQQTQTQPFISALGGVAYLGDSGHVGTQVSLTELENFNVPGDAIFGHLATATILTNELRPALSRDTRLEDLTGANSAGIRKGSIVLTDDEAVTVQVDLSKADTVGDVVDMINDTAESAGLNLSVDIEGRGLLLSSSGAVVRDTSTGLTASDLGLAATSEGNAPVDVIDLSPRLTPHSTIDSLNEGAGVELDGGIRITNGSRSIEIDLSQAETIQDVVNLINTSGLYVKSRINDAGTGLEITSQVAGVTMSISETGGTTAADLGIVTFGPQTPLAELNFGKGVHVLEGEADLRIESKDGDIFEVNLDGAQTLGDVVDLINEAAGEAGVSIEAGFHPDTNGIVIEDSTGGTGALTVGRSSIGSFAVDDLGLSGSVQDPETQLVGRDVAVVRADNVFTALIDLERALRSNDEAGIGNAAERLKLTADDVLKIHGTVGARSQAMRARVEQTENAVVATRALLSNIEDLDYTEAVTKFQQAQTALQANLLSGSQLLNLSLLDFLR